MVRIAQTIAATIGAEMAAPFAAPYELSSTCAYNACCRRLKDTVHIAQTIAATIGAETAAPFEFRVLEALLAETAHHFEGKSR